MAQRKTALEEIAEKESNFGKVFKVAGPCNLTFFENMQLVRRGIEDIKELDFKEGEMVVKEKKY